MDDAGVYRLDDETALIQTVDFFTPVVDDPWTYGAIAAANSLSDVYAMGGRPLTALAVAGVPEGFDIGMLGDILAGGQEKAREAGVPIVGGHTVKCPELKYGLAVTGVVHPDRVITNAGAGAGDRLRRVHRHNRIRAGRTRTPDGPLERDSPGDRGRFSARSARCAGGRGRWIHPGRPRSQQIAF